MQHPFLHRLRLERLLVRSVNSQLPKSFPTLGGTSAAAVDSWYGSLESSEVREDLPYWMNVSQLIKHVGLRLRLNSDASHRGYSEERLLDSDESSFLIQEISTLLATRGTIGSIEFGIAA